MIKISIIILLVILQKSSVNCQCNGLTCLNSGSLNVSSCTCSCFNNYNGTRCENLLCGRSQPDTCLIYNTGLCQSSIISSFCPHLCGRCRSTTIATTLATTLPRCSGVQCRNNGALNMTSCKCNCFSNYDGDFCENLLCNRTDPRECLGYRLGDCVVELIRSYCPRMCRRYNCFKH